MRYIGSKRRLSKYILQYINKALSILPDGKYIEPFVGGCNIIDKVDHHTRIGCDANPYLIALLKETKDNTENIQTVKPLSRKAFSYVKSNKELFCEWFVGLVGFTLTYANGWFQSYTHHLERNRFAESINALTKQDLSNIKFINCDYKNIPIGKGNVVYCDPPYKIYDYYKMPFNHDEFYQWVRDISQDNIVFVSEYEMPDDFTCVWQKTIKPGINPKACEKTEKLFMYKR